ncbi:YlaI family protein [Virgibacillus sp. W0430]|uniref:YlaI family protein n=1 Tax=Virgibacillus sp. W0430 TaxID=3391580 RepID=UPI003F48F244
MKQTDFVEVKQMQVKCVLCDQIEDIDDDALQAKRLRNRKLNMYLCTPCNERIAKNTKKRHKSGNFHLFKEKKDTNDYL